MAGSEGGQALLSNSLVGYEELFARGWQRGAAAWNRASLPRNAFAQMMRFSLKLQ